MNDANRGRDGGMADEVHIVLVQVGPHRCGLFADDVVEVLQAVRVVPLPGAPAAVEGAINFRGTLVPVFDLRQRFGLEERQVIPQDRLVVMSSGGRSVALRADHALDLVVVARGDLQQAPTVGAVGGAATGLVRMPDDLVVVVDPDTFVAGEEAIVLDAVLAATDLDPS